ncbi:MAG: hypothetical protein JWN48_2074 [Myxococcaceae bacterium]|nr:hypothetical protein [Myxococcaceae bacterium]
MLAGSTLAKSGEIDAKAWFPNRFDRIRSANCVVALSHVWRSELDSAELTVAAPADASRSSWCDPPAGLEGLPATPWVTVPATEINRQEA